MVIGRIEGQSRIEFRFTRNLDFIVHILKAVQGIAGGSYRFVHYIEERLHQRRQMNQNFCPSLTSHMIMSSLGKPEALLLSVMPG